MPPKTRRIAVLGFRAVGKSSLTIQFVENHFVDSYYPTIETTFTKTLKYRGQEFITEITDTAGQDEYSIMNSKHALGVHGYVFVYSITLKSSFENCKVMRDKILDCTGTDWVPIVLVGNKSDLNAQRQVPREAAEALAAEWKCAFVEASAKHNENINLIFDHLLDLIEKSENPKPQNDNNCALV